MTGKDSNTWGLIAIVAVVALTYPAALMVSALVVWLCAR